MLSLLIENCTANTKMLQRFLSDVPTEKMHVQPNGLVNHPLWTIGHLTQSRSGMLGQIGKKADLPEDWPKRFGRGSIPVADASAYGTREEMMATFLRVHEQLMAELRAVDEKVLEAPHGIERFAAIFPTKRHLIWNVLTTHDGIHIGEMADFRRAIGLGTVI